MNVVSRRVPARENGRSAWQTGPMERQLDYVMRTVEERGVRLEFIQPGKPVQNAYVESFNGRLDECLNANWFTSRPVGP